MQHTRRENPAYLQYIREQPCCFCAAPPPSDPHHWRGRGPRDEKRNDYEVVPICRLDHDRWHNWGPEKFFKFHNAHPIFFLGELMSRLLSGFFTRPDQNEAPI